MDLSKVYNNALLSEASYANFTSARKSDGSYDEALVGNLLFDSGFSKTQAADFVTHWRVVDHQQNTSSGFSATVFESNKFDGHTKRQHEWRFLA